MKHQGRIKRDTYGIAVVSDDRTSNQLILHIITKWQKTGIGKGGLWTVYSSILELSRLVSMLPR